MTGERPIFIDFLTFAGRLLFVFCVIFFAAGFYLLFYAFADSGLSFPLFLALMPPAVASPFVFFGVAWLLERCGIKIHIKKEADGGEQKETADI